MVQSVMVHLVKEILHLLSVSIMSMEKPLEKYFVKAEHSIVPQHTFTKMAAKFLLALVIFCMVKKQCDATATLSVRFEKFFNPGDRTSQGELTDSTTNAGDPAFVICIDNACGNSDFHSCRYALHRTVTVVDHAGATLIFGSSMNKLGGGSIPNPFNVSFSTWPGTVMLKVRILENDGANNHLPTQHIDDMFDFIELNPASSQGLATWHDRKLAGSRPMLYDQTSLEYSVMLYCDDGFHGPYCDQVYGQNSCN